MSDLTLTATRFSQGIWEGRLEGAATARPDLAVTHLGAELAGVTLTPDPQRAGAWDLAVPVPATALGDGVQSFVISDRASGADLGQFAIAAGEALEGDLRAEIDLLRAELDLLKRAFRRHCAETGKG